MNMGIDETGHDQKPPSIYATVDVDTFWQVAGITHEYETIAFNQYRRRPQHSPVGVDGHHPICALNQRSGHGAALSPPASRCNRHASDF
jgi:hypothetical protein